MFSKPAYQHTLIFAPVAPKRYGPVVAHVTTSLRLMSRGEDGYMPHTLTEFDLHARIGHL